MLVPKFFSTLKGYNRAQFTADLSAGVIVGIVALPLAIAFAIASGVTPDRGLYTAIIGGFLISALGGSRVQIGGPTGAFVVIVYGIVQKFGVDGLIVATLIAGVFLVILGAVKLGSVIKFIPHPVVIGFTSGIAVIIFSSQVKDFLGLRMGSVPADFLEKWAAFATHLASLNVYAVGVSALALGIIVAWPRINRRIPSPFVALVVATLVVQVFHLPVETIGSRFGGISASLPHLTLPHPTLSQIQLLIGPAFTIALLGAVESLLSAVVADGMIGGHHRSNMELVAQGVANIVTPLFGGIPATGAIARTATNVRSGARTPVAGIIHAVTLLGLLLFGARLAGHVPMAVLAAILFVVAANMGEWHEIPLLVRQTKTDVAVWVTTFALTVLADLTVAVEVGMILAALLYIRRVSSTTTVDQVTPEYLKEGRVHILQDKHIPDYVTILRIHGPFLFGTTDKLQSVVDRIDELTPIVIFRLRNMTAIDATGLRALEDLTVRLHSSGRAAIFCGARDQPRAVMEQAGFIDLVGAENICPNVDAALNRARAVHDRLPIAS